MRLEDLPVEYREQARAQLDRKPKTRKYHNEPTARLTPNGKQIVFDSRKEAERYDELVLLQNAGMIRNLRLQAEYTLQEAYTDVNGNRVRAIRYVADFVYDALQCGEWKEIIEDVKSNGTRTKAYIIKSKLFRSKYGKEITEHYG